MTQDNSWKRVSYTIEITQTCRRTVKDTKSFITKETPTEIESGEIYNRGKKLVANEYEVRDYDKTEEVNGQVYRQTVADLDLPAVIAAVNKLKATGEA